MMASFTSEERAFKVDINITKLDDSSPVFYKIDGERFKETHTLKLQIETTYRVSLEFRPPVEVRCEKCFGWHTSLPNPLSSASVQRLT